MRGFPGRGAHEKTNYPVGLHCRGGPRERRRAGAIAGHRLLERGKRPRAPEVLRRAGGAPEAQGFCRVGGIERGAGSDLSAHSGIAAIECVAADDLSAQSCIRCSTADAIGADSCIGCNATAEIGARICIGCLAVDATFSVAPGARPEADVRPERVRSRVHSETRRGACAGSRPDHCPRELGHHQGARRLPRYLR
jgi:hypothetical protein